MTPAQLALFTAPAATQPLTRTTRNRRAATRVVYQPWPCVILGVDTASVSGWAVRVRGKLVWSGQCRANDQGELDAVIQGICELARSHQLPVVLVLEKAFGHRTNVLLALGAARGAWLAAWKRAGLPRTHVVSVYPVTWRARLGVQAPRAQRIKGAPRSWGALRAQRENQARIELAAARTEVAAGCALGADEAAAILISRWAAHAPDVNAVIPKRHRRTLDNG